MVEAGREKKKRRREEEKKRKRRAGRREEIIKTSNRAAGRKGNLRQRPVVKGKGTNNNKFATTDNFSTTHGNFIFFRSISGSPMRY